MDTLRIDYSSLISILLAQTRFDLTMLRIDYSSLISIFERDAVGGVAGYGLTTVL